MIENGQTSSIGIFLTTLSILVIVMVLYFINGLIQSAMKRHRHDRILRRNPNRIA